MLETIHSSREGDLIHLEVNLLEDAAYLFTDTGHVTPWSLAVYTHGYCVQCFQAYTVQLGGKGGGGG